ncbi:MAG: GH3 auxin-responsive promoter family protein [Myxococcales bacterium]|nr:GH3 auxin-responsive promoter family protein [Myxococcales bacterium]
MSPWVSGLLSRLFVRFARHRKLRFDRDAAHASQVNDDTLMAILRRNRGSEFGRKHGFAQIDSPATYRRKLPLATHDDFLTDIERMSNGAQNILCTDRLSGFGLTSGTTGKSKMVPISTSQRRKTALAMMFLPQGFVADLLPETRQGGRGLLLLNASTPGQTVSGLPVGPGTSLGMRHVLRMSSLFWTSPSEAYQISNQADALYVHLLFALIGGDARFISAPFASTVLDLFHTLELRAAELVYDVRHGTLLGVPNIDPRLRQRLQKRLLPQPDLSTWLADELSAGMDGIATRLFPQLTYINTVTSGGFALYAKRLLRYVGELPVYSSIYASTEAVLGIGVGLDAARYALIPGQAYCEFIPEGHIDESQPTTWQLNELQVGHRYEIVLSTFSGLYRYRLGDIIEVIDHYQRTPLVEFVHRRGALLNICGEKTSERTAYTALLRSTGLAGLQLADFTTRIDTDSLPQRYVFYIELGASERPTDVAALAAKLVDSIDSALCQGNSLYELSRKSARIGAAEVRFVRSGTFRRLRDIFVQRGASPTQVKVPRVLGDPDMIAVLEENPL